MRSKRSRLRLVGVLALAFSITAGLSVTTAEAQKKGKKKNNVTRSCDAAPIPDAVAGFASSPVICDMMIGKKFRGLQVGRVELRDQSYTGTETGALNDIGARLVSPEGTSHFAEPPFTPVMTMFTTVGPFDYKPNTPTEACISPPCSNPFATASPPYSGATIQNPGLSRFKNEKVRGTWSLRLWDEDAGEGTSTFNGAQLFIKFYKPPKN